MTGEPATVLHAETGWVARPAPGPAGGYREHDTLVITEDGNCNITGFPYSPEHNIIGT